MYVLIVARGYPSERYKTNGIFEFDQAKALANAGQKVIYAAIDVRSIRRTRKWGFESFKKEGVQIEAINIPCGRIPEIILNRIRIMALRKLYKHINNKYGQPEIIHAHFLSYGYIAVKAFEKSNIPLVVVNGHLKNSIFGHKKTSNFGHEKPAVIQNLSLAITVEELPRRQWSVAERLLGNSHSLSPVKLTCSYCYLSSWLY